MSKRTIVEGIDIIRDLSQLSSLILFSQIFYNREKLIEEIFLDIVLEEEIIYSRHVDEVVMKMIGVTEESIHNFIQNLT